MTIQQALDLALQHHTAGSLPQAESIYQQILQSDPNQPVALHLLGVIAPYMGKTYPSLHRLPNAHPLPFERTVFILFRAGKFESLVGMIQTIELANGLACRLVKVAKVGDSVFLRIPSSNMVFPIVERV